MDLLRILLSTSAFLCSLIAGFLFAFAVVVMPGIKSLSDHDFLRAFQAIDRTIQNGQPLFGFVWLGSILSTIATMSLGTIQLSGLNQAMIIGIGITYLLGVQLTTMSINVPLNNRLQEYELANLSPEELASARQAFEPRWGKWNTIRTILSVCVAALLIWLVART